MARPYVSHKRLLENSQAAMLAAVEMYNKPQTQYREQVVVVLVVNAWELLLKAVLRKEKKNIFYKKKRGEDYRSISLEHCLRDMDKYRLWPEAVDGDAVRANIEVLTKYRNQIIHLYVAEGLEAILYCFLQQSIVNYRDLAVNAFNRDIAEEITWTLLPLAATLPNESIRSLRVIDDKHSSKVVENFIDELRLVVTKAEDSGVDMRRVAVVQQYKFTSGKGIGRADLEVAIDKDSNNVVVQRKVDPNSTHPFSFTELTERVNRARKAGRTLTSHDMTCMIWKHSLRDDPKYAWKSNHSQVCVWSGDALAFLRDRTEAEYDAVRKKYRKAQRQKRRAAKRESATR